MDLNFPGSNLRDYIRIIFRHKAVIITSFITVTMSVIIGLELKTPMYESQVKMLVSAEKATKSAYYTRLSLLIIQVWVMDKVVEYLLPRARL